MTLIDELQWSAIIILAVAFAWYVSSTWRER